MLAETTLTLPVLGIGLLAGCTALILVANELGCRAGMTRTGRTLLASGLGVGVLAVSIKVMIIAALGQIDDLGPTPAGIIVRQGVENQVSRIVIEAPIRAVDTHTSSFGTWRPLPHMPKAPKANPTTPEKVTLGQALFFDPNLSVDRTISCASCHVLADGGDDNAPVSTGVKGGRGDRNAPTVLNAAFLSRLFWNGRAASLEAQASGPLVNPLEMAMPSLHAVESRVAETAAYRAKFDAAFGKGSAMSIQNITRAIAAYERTLITPNTPYDLFVRGEDTALTPAALRGMALFDEIGCRNCHMDPVFSSAGTVKSMGVYRRFPVHADDNPFLDKYELLVDGAPAVWRVPGLRNVAATAPYFHNGSVDSLEEAIRVMAVSQLGRVLSDDPEADLKVLTIAVEGVGQGRDLTLIRDRSVSEQEISDLAAFLRSLTASHLSKGRARPLTTIGR